MTQVPPRRLVPIRRLISFLLLVVCVQVASAQSLTPQRFRFDARQLSEKPASVNLAGSFNGWSTVATPMGDPDGDGVYEVEVKLADGVHFYKFVINGDQWINDPDSDKELEQPDGHGGVNSAVLIGPDVRNLPPPRPGHINAQALLHDPSNATDSNSAGNGMLRIRLRAQADDVKEVSLILGSGKPGLFPLHRLGTVMGYDLFAAVIPVEGDSGTYFFEAKDGDATALLFANRVVTKHPMNGEGRFFEASTSTSFVTPDWAKHAVWYQIFPERFRNGDTSNDPGEKDFENLLPWTADWWKIHAKHGEAPGKENFYRGEGNVWKRRFGGDIQGVKEALPYLRSLGINAIYFNPVFEGDSMHKYDASDFRHIDDNFGVKLDNEVAIHAEAARFGPDVPRRAPRPLQYYNIDGTPATGLETDDPTTWKWSKSDLIFLDFIAEAHRQGFKVIIDGVFNHVGRSHPFFQDVLKNGKDSKYADWFEITDWGTGGEPGTPGGIQWRAWDRDNGHLPVFKKDPERGLAPGPYEHIMAITKRWLAPDGDPSRGIDGWRLDVPGDIPHPFWIEWRKVVKETKPDAYITGEIWDWAQPWLQGDQFDAVMNYRFAVACQDFFVNQQKAITPTEFNSRLVQMIFAYPLQVALVNQNLFDSHDTDRLASMFVNPDLPYDGANRIQDNGPDYKKDRPNDQQWTRKRQAVTFQMLFLGAPMVYYGSEAGMWSPDDPSNRMPMWWKDHEPFEDPQFKFDDAHFMHYQRSIAIRNKFPALRTGFFRPILIDDEKGIYAFARELGEQRVYVVLNRSDEKVVVEVPIDPAAAELINWMNGDHARVIQPQENDPAGRPTLAATNDAPRVQSKSGKATIELAPYGTAVLAPATDR